MLFNPLNRYTDTMKQKTSSRKKRYQKLILVTSVVLSELMPQIAWSQQANPAQNLQQLRDAAIVYLHRLPALDPDSQINVPPLDPALKLSQCSNLDFFLPNPNIQRGNFRLGVRCAEPQTWSTFLSVSVIEPKTYFVTRRALLKNHRLKLEDLVRSKSYNLNNIANLITDPQQFIDRHLARPLPEGSTLKTYDLGADPSLMRGQTVKIIISNSGFKITNQGQLLANAIPGQTARAKTASNQIVTGIARSGGILEIDLH